MATKSERFKAQAARDAKPPKPKRAPRPRRDEVVDTSEPGVSATDRRAARGPRGSRNTSKRSEAKGGAALEDTTGDPSRKSTRRAVGRAKRTSNLALRAKRRASSPTTRAKKAAPKKAATKKAATKKGTAATKKPRAKQTSTKARRK